MDSQVISSQAPATVAPASPKPAKQRRRVCNVCGQPSGPTICPACSDRIRAEALARKKREDKGEE